MAIEVVPLPIDVDEIHPRQMLHVTEIRVTSAGHPTFGKGAVDYELAVRDNADGQFSIPQQDRTVVGEASSSTLETQLALVRRAEFDQ
jgi:hypothetical protein